jgi:type II secretory pathway pseudopilin PulG
MRSGERAGRGRARGFTYIGLLVLVVLIGIMLAAAGQVASTTAQRERETELLFIGHQYRDAIGRFVAMNRRFPQELNELLGAEADSPMPVHFIRRLYADPMTRTVDWVLVPAPDGGIAGVASSSPLVPLKHANFDGDDLGFGDAATYRDWIFQFNPRRRLPPVAVRAPAPAPAPSSSPAPPRARAPSPAPAITFHR